ncbi:MoaD/ThiS family protein [Campylobacter pinnipediorum]|uniref:Molybdopterin synthase sulfur carrier subunit n=1 Tax=Campylobacter pinnipediorum subsp. pinnipediorum TaxID=1660067 RepID=A0AAX0LAM5_9BACT|nr:MoaD/ThiS family protein [Campylobacter pinnipediorum]OPA77297.1 molybdopterin synthase sulfur carrier subunit [Campylobacter pinnipediorum subsp. pinnipediorum]
MVKVEFLGPINKPSLELDVKNLKELKEILNKDEELKIWLKECGVAINDEIVTNLDTELKNGDKVVLLAPVCGG